jgi:hypothetical protein
MLSEHARDPPPIEVRDGLVTIAAKPQGKVGIVAQRGPGVDETRLASFANDEPALTLADEGAQKIVVRAVNQNRPAGAEVFRKLRRKGGGQRIAVDEALVRPRQRNEEDVLVAQQCEIVAAAPGALHLDRGGTDALRPQDVGARSQVQTTRYPARTAVFAARTTAGLLIS